MKEDFDGTNTSVRTITVEPDGAETYPVLAVQDGNDSPVSDRYNPSGSVSPERNVIEGALRYLRARTKELRDPESVLSVAITTSVSV